MSDEFIAINALSYKVPMRMVILLILLFSGIVGDRRSTRRINSISVWNRCLFLNLIF